MTARPPEAAGEAIIGVDVGGTLTAAGAVTRDGVVLCEESAPTHRDGPGTAARLILELIAAVKTTCDSRGLTVPGIGLGVPGVVDAEAGIVGPEAPHVPELQGQPVAALVSAHFALPAFVDNDTNAHALGEWRFGAARGARSLVVLAAGTGFGSGIVLDGALVRGASGFGGELGHTPVRFDGRRCWCGGRGCVAVYASGRGIAEAARAGVAGQSTAGRAAGRRGAGAPPSEATDTMLLLHLAGGDPRQITAPLVFRAAAGKDPIAMEIVAEACQALGAAIAVVVNGLNPEVVVITGGVAASLVPLEADVRRAASEYCFARALASTRIQIVPGDKRVTMRGAAVLVLYELERRGAPPLAVRPSAGQTPRP